MPKPRGEFAHPQFAEDLHRRRVVGLLQRFTGRGRPTKFTIEIFGCVIPEANGPVLDDRLRYEKTLIKGEAINKGLQGGARGIARLDGCRLRQFAKKRIWLLG